MRLEWVTYAILDCHVQQVQEKGSSEYVYRTQMTNWKKNCFCINSELEKVKRTLIQRVKTICSSECKHHDSNHVKDSRDRDVSNGIVNHILNRSTSIEYKPKAEQVIYYNFKRPIWETPCTLVALNLTFLDILVTSGVSRFRVGSLV